MTAHAVELERRELLAALAALAGVALLPSGAGAADASLTGMVMPLAGATPVSLDTSHAFLDALAAELGDKLTALAGVVRENPGDGLAAAITAADMDDVANRVIEVFYTGIVTKDGKQTTLHYLDTLQWQVLEDFTKAPSRCGPDFGFWTNAPDL